MSFKIHQPPHRVNTKPLSVFRRRKWLFIAVGGIGIVAIGLFAKLFLSSSLGEDVVDAPPAMLERYGWFKLPPHAREVRSHVIAWQDYLVKAKFVILPDELEGLLKSSLCTGSTLTTQPVADDYLAADPQDAWMSPGHPAKSESFRGEKGSVSQFMLIDESRLNEYTVYVWTSSR